MKHAIAILCFAFLFCGAAFAEEAAVEIATESVSPRFEFLKGLSGEWVTIPQSEDESEQVMTFSLVADGSAMLEREMVGTPNEMITMYRFDGDVLKANHYCMLHNQPELEADDDLEGQSLRFTCNGNVGNTQSHDELHVHAWTINLDEEGGMTYSVDFFKDGQIVNNMQMVLKRAE
jgi:hypothetical protein